MRVRDARDAVLIVDPGACNARGVARALVEMVDHMREDREDSNAAVRLTMDQLAHLVGYPGRSDLDAFGADLRECRAIAMAKPRDMSRMEFERSMRGYGWEPSFLGYWQRNGLGINEQNYPTRRAALAAYIAAGAKHDAEREAREAARKQGTVQP